MTYGLEIPCQTGLCNSFVSFLLHEHRLIQYFAQMISYVPSPAALLKFANILLQFTLNLSSSSLKKSPSYSNYTSHTNFR